MDEVNDARLLAVASERMAHFNPATLISEEEMTAVLVLQKTILPVLTR